jgi:hypothetical protein
MLRFILLIILCLALLVAGALLALFAIRGWQKGQRVRKRAIPCAAIGIGLLVTGTVAYVQASSPMDSPPVTRSLAELQALPDGSPALLEGHVSSLMRTIEGSYVAYVRTTNGTPEFHTPVLLITLSDGSEITLSDGGYAALNWPISNQAGDKVHYLTNGDPVVAAGQVRQWTEELGNCEYVGQRSAGFLFFTADVVFAGTMDSYRAYLNPAWPIVKVVPYLGWVAGILLIVLAVGLGFSHRFRYAGSPQALASD